MDANPFNSYFGVADRLAQRKRSGRQAFRRGLTGHAATTFSPPQQRNVPLCLAPSGRTTRDGRRGKNVKAAAFGPPGAETSGILGLQFQNVADDPPPETVKSSRPRLPRIGIALGSIPARVEFSRVNKMTVQG
jgi:hypothetical protein